MVSVSSTLGSEKQGIASAPALVLLNKFDAARVEEVAASSAANVASISDRVESRLSEMAERIEAEPDIYFRPAYYGPSDWIGIRLDRHGVDWDHVASWLATSWRIVAPLRLTRLLRAAEDF